MQRTHRFNKFGLIPPAVMVILLFAGHPCLARPLDELVNEGKAEMKAGHYESAAELFSQAIAKRPKDEALINERAICWSNLKKYDLALRDFSLLQKMSPNDTTINNNLAMTFFLLKRYDEGLKYADKAVSIKSKATNHETRGQLYFGLKKYEQALADLDKALELNPNSGESLYYRSMVHAKLGHKDQAAKDKLRSKEVGYIPETHPEHEVTE